jgi:FHS family L-fucose permease-like MFS transporter
VALLGPERTSSSRLTLAQALNSFGTFLAPLFGGMLILSSVVKSPAELAALPPAEHLAYQAQQAQAVQGPYIGLAVVLFLLAVFVWLFRLPALSEATDKGDHDRHSFAEVLRHPHVLFGVLGIFFYVGAEVSIGSFMVNYLSQPEIGHVSEQQAAKYVSYYWLGAMIGRFIGSALMAKFSPRKLLAGFAAINALLVLTTMLTAGDVAMVSIIAIGLFNSIMFPTIFALGIERLGSMTSKASSLLIMAIVGGAIIPPLQGLLADHIGLQHAFFLPLLCYLYIVFYGLSGSRIRGLPADASQRGS